LSLPVSRVVFNLHHPTLETPDGEQEIPFLKIIIIIVVSLLLRPPILMRLCFKFYCTQNYKPPTFFSTTPQGTVLKNCNLLITVDLFREHWMASSEERLSKRGKVNVSIIYSRINFWRIFKFDGKILNLLNNFLVWRKFIKNIANFFVKIKGSFVIKFKNNWALNIKISFYVFTFKNYPKQHFHYLPLP
jgi:hypothetical protein